MSGAILSPLGLPLESGVYVVRELRGGPQMFALPRLPAAPGARLPRLQQLIPRWTALQAKPLSCHHLY